MGSVGSVRAWGTTTWSEAAANGGDNHANSEVAATAPVNWVTTNIGTSIGLMPANVSVNARASVTAGLANEVDAVNQYAEVIYAPTAKGVAAGRRLTPPQITASRPNVATNSLNICGLRPAIFAHANIDAS
jgi:hypothetical protein